MLIFPRLTAKNAKLLDFLKVYLKENSLRFMENVV